MRVQSEITGEWYQTEDAVHFRNHYQAAHYRAWGAKLIDLFVDSQYKWVYVFDREDHNRLKMRWAARTQNEESASADMK